MAGLYSYYLAPLVLTPAQVNTPQMVNTGNRLGGWLLIQNNSPYKIQVNLPGSSGNYLPLDPQTVDKFKMGMGDQQIYILPLTLLPQAAPSSQVDIQVYPGDENEPPGQYPMALTRQAAPTSGAEQFGYTVIISAGIGSSQTVDLTVFNPSNNTKSFVFFSAKTVITFASGTPEADLNAQTIDPSYSSALTPRPHTIGGPASTAHATGQLGAAETGTLVEAALNYVSAQIYEFIPFPDQKKAPPGTGWNIHVSGLPGTGGQVTEIMKWTEQ